MTTDDDSEMCQILYTVTRKLSLLKTVSLNTRTFSGYRI